MTRTRSEPRFDIFKRADLGTALAAIAVVAGFGFRSDVPFAILAVYVAIFLSRRPTEEFGLACWQAGCVAVFRALIVAAILIPFVVGLVGGFTDGITGMPPPTDPKPDGLRENILDAAPLIALLAFFYGFQRKRFKGE